ncbi:DUF1822 family protein [Argonema antarcticum A004/B2]|nr:DUF1822 family protein [Argonema antarcticum]MCL1472877.1 DUF1822 family protein [Argonema antarcticum A004/B2]
MLPKITAPAYCLKSDSNKSVETSQTFDRYIRRKSCLSLRMTDLGLQLAGHSVALMVAILEKRQGKVAVLLRVYPMKNRVHLPPNLELVVLESCDTLPDRNLLVKKNYKLSEIAIFYTSPVTKSSILLLTGLSIALP